MPPLGFIVKLHVSVKTNETNKRTFSHKLSASLCDVFKIPPSQLHLIFVECTSLLMGNSDSPSLCFEFTTLVSGDVMVDKETRENRAKLTKMTTEAAEECLAIDPTRISGTFRVLNSTAVCFGGKMQKG